ncbi:MAG: glycosyltransferase family 4 protein [Candidatus Woesearchaeota archaeon]
MTKILYVSGTYVPSTGGAEISAHELLRRVQDHSGLEALVLTDERYAPRDRRREGVRILGTTHDRREGALREVIGSFEPDLVLTQLLWSDVALRVSNEQRIPSVLRVSKIPFELDISSGAEHSPSGIMCVSQYAQDYVRERWDRESTVVPPLIDPEKVTAPGEKRDNPYVLMFNRLERKGAGTFARIAAQMQDERFAIVSGWNILRNAEGFDESLLHNMCESLGVRYAGKPPRTVDTFPSNVTLLDEDHDVRRIYSQAKVLCVPSIWEETFGRVVVEAFYNRIPVISSAVGGLQEHARQGGIVIEEYLEPAAWIAAIRSLENPIEYRATIDRGTRFVQECYDPQEITKRFVDFAEHVKDDG